MVHAILQFSTCGIVPRIYDFSKAHTQYNLAISLHAPNQALRQELMPVSKAYPLDELMEAIRFYGQENNRRLTFEYILLKGVNDQPEHARQLAKLLKGLNAYVNLIPYNSVDEKQFKSVKHDEAMVFYDLLMKNHVRATIRKEHGQDIDAVINDIAKAYQDAILDFYNHGCRYLQIDDTSWTYMIDDDFVKKVEALGYTKEQVLNWFVTVSTKALENHPKDMKIATHFCKGNFKGNPLFHGFYDTIAKSVASIPYDGYFVEYDDARSGSFEPWKILKGSDRTFVVGLISTKNPRLETKEEIKERFLEAKEVIGDNLALSPQCGFASVEEGNCIDEETQWKKIDLLISCKDFI